LDGPAPQGSPQERASAPAQAVAAIPSIIVSEKEQFVSEYLYARGQHVTFTTKRVTGTAWSGAFIVTKLLPSGGQEPRYEIKSTGEAYSRAALESELTARLDVFQPADR
jgi:hypothetical protein